MSDDERAVVNCDQGPDLYTQATTNT